jgi:hypothetical protein
MEKFVKMSMALNEQELNQYINNGARTITSIDCEGFFRKMVGYMGRCINEEIILDKIILILFYLIVFLIAGFVILIVCQNNKN